MADRMNGDPTGSRPQRTQGRVDMPESIGRAGRLTALALASAMVLAGSGTVSDAGRPSPAGIGGLIGLDAAGSLLTVTEGQDTDAIVVVVRGGSTLGMIGAGFATNAGSAAAGLDFGVRNGVVAFPNGDAVARFIVVPIIDDALVEEPEQFTVSLSQPTGGAALGPVTTLTVTILDDDVAPPVDLVFSDGFEAP